jgi:hypothetical protein
MPFGLINARENFQRAMGIEFMGLISNCVVVYLNDVTIFSKDKRDHISHLVKIFNRCRRYEISLNPKKFSFAVNEGKLLGFVVSKYGIMIELERTKSISKIPFPHNKKNPCNIFLGK